MKTLLVGAMAFLVSCAVMAEAKYIYVPYEPDPPPKPETRPPKIYCAGFHSDLVWLPDLFDAGYIEERDMKNLHLQSGAKKKDWDKYVKVTPIGYREIGPVPPVAEFYPDGYFTDEILYQLIQHMRLTNMAGKTYEFLVIRDGTNYTCQISRPLIIEISPNPGKIVGKWSGLLDEVERFKHEKPRTAPNLLELFPDLIQQYLSEPDDDE